MKNPEIVAIAALGKDTRDICHDSELLWRIPEDLQRVRQETLGHPIIMGRKTYESIGKPLPGRTNIVLTRNTDFRAPGIVVVHSANEAIETAKRHEGGEEKIVIFGGAEIYTLFLPKTDALKLTLVDSTKKGTAQFPEYTEMFTETKRSEIKIYDDNGINTPYEWVDYIRN